MPLAFMQLDVSNPHTWDTETLKRFLTAVFTTLIIVIGLLPKSFADLILGQNKETGRVCSALRIVGRCAVRRGREQHKHPENIHSNVGSGASFPDEPSCLFLGVRRFDLDANHPSHVRAKRENVSTLRRAVSYRRENPPSVQFGCDSEFSCQVKERIVFLWYENLPFLENQKLRFGSGHCGNGLAESPGGCRYQQLFQGDLNFLKGLE